MHAFPSFCLQDNIPNITLLNNQKESHQECLAMFIYNAVFNCKFVDGEVKQFYTIYYFRD